MFIYLFTGITFLHDMEGHVNKIKASKVRRCDNQRPEIRTSEIGLLHDAHFVILCFEVRFSHQPLKDHLILHCLNPQPTNAGKLACVRTECCGYNLVCP